MQTFLPYADFEKTAKVLDYRRLGKQRVEAYQILNTLTGKSTGWRNHPAVKMWKGYEFALFKYAQAICKEWVARGYKDTVYDKLDKLYAEMNEVVLAAPPWLGDAEFHKSHRSNLLRKQPDHYRKYWPRLTDTLPYKWPV